MKCLVDASSSHRSIVICSAIHRADADLKKLWQDSKQVNEVEQHRLVDKLLHVGLL